jgi:iron(III) transport system permease protein
MGIGRMRMIRDVFVPAGLGTVAEMFSYMFVNSMMTISAVSFLSTLSTRPISLMINQFESQMQYESAAVVSLVILGVNMLLKAVMGLVGNRRRGVSLKQKKTI